MTVLNAQNLRIILDKNAIRIKTIFIMSSRNSTTRSFRPNDHVRNKIRSLRQSKQLKLKEVAFNAGMALSSYAALEYGDSPLTVNKLWDVLSALDSGIFAVWPQAGRSEADRAELLLFCTQMRLRDLIRVSKAHGAALVKKREQQVAVMLQEGFSRSRLEQIRSVLTKKETEAAGVLFEESRANVTVFLYLDRAKHPEWVKPLAQVYLADWVSLALEGLL